MRTVFYPRRTDDAGALYPEFLGEHHLTPMARHNSRDSQAVRASADAHRTAASSHGLKWPLRPNHLAVNQGEQRPDGMDLILGDRQERLVQDGQVGDAP